MRGTLGQRVRRNTPDHYQFCSCAREVCWPSINAFLLMFQEVRSISKTCNQLFVIMEHATRRILHSNVTAHPTAHWALQQLRDAIPADHTYRFLLHDRDSIFSQQLDQSIRNLGLWVLKTPPQTPQANALCERLLGTLRRECLDCVIPLTENHLGRLLHLWVPHYNHGRPHMALGPGLPQPSLSIPVSLQAHRHRLPPPLRVGTRPILGGLHHEYWLEEQAA